AVFLETAAFVAGRELAEAQALWSAAQAEAPRLGSPFDAAWFASLLTRRPGAAAEDRPPPDAPARPPRRQHWGEAPDVAAFLGRGEAPPAGAAAQLERLLELVQQSTCLLVLDNVETVLEPGQRAGSYRPGFEAYGRLLRELGESPHQSCLLLTSREEPPEVG